MKFIRADNVPVERIKGLIVAADHAVNARVKPV